MVQLHSCVQMSKAVGSIQLTHGDQRANRGRSALWLTLGFYLNQQAVNSRHSKCLQAIASGETLARHRRNTPCTQPKTNSRWKLDRQIQTFPPPRSRPSHPSQIFAIKTQITIKSSQIRPWQQRLFFTRRARGQCALRLGGGWHSHEWKIHGLSKIPKFIAAINFGHPWIQKFIVSINFWPF